VGVIIALGVVGFFFVVLPLCWLLFYRGRNVKATCEAQNPAPSWTDRCPLPVLALSLTMAIGVPMMFALPFAYHGVLPFFGTFLTGWIGGGTYWLLGVVWGYAAWATYRLDRRGWWTVLAALILFGVSACITYSLHSLADVYRMMGLPETQIAQIQAVPGMGAHGLVWITLASSALMVGYTLYTGRYFKHSAAEVQP
jgi:hypothetical protein